MKYRAIIGDAWTLTQTNKGLIWWFAFVPALITTLVSIIYLSYQVMAFWTSPLFRSSARPGEEILATLFNMAKDLVTSQPGLAVFAVVIVAIVGLMYLMLPVFTQGALIQLVARKKAGKEISILDGVSFGFNRFLQLFEYHLIVKTFSIVGIFTEAAFVLRNLGLEAFALLGWIFLLVFGVGMALSLLFTYSEYYIVIDRESVFKSMLNSSALVFRNWHHTLFMFILMMIISLRILINLVVALLIPILVLGPLFIFTSITLAKIGVIVGAVVGVIALYFTSYFLGIFHVFATSVWTFTFLELTMRQADDNNLRSQVEAVHKEESQVENTES